MADFFKALVAGTEQPAEVGELINTRAVRALLGRSPSCHLAGLKGFPSPVSGGVCGKPFLYLRRDVEAWQAGTDERRHAVKATRTAGAARLSRERAAKAQAADEARWNSERRPDWASLLRHSDRSGVDGIDESPAVLAAEAERDNGTAKVRHRDQWDHISIETDARPDPVKLAKSEAAYARMDALCLDGTRRKKHEPAPPTLAARVTDPDLMMASVRARVSAHHPGAARPRPENLELSGQVPPPARRGHKAQAITLAQPIWEAASAGS